METIAIPVQIAPPSFTSKQDVKQLTYLKQLAGSMNSVFQLSSGETSVIEDIAKNGGATLAANGKTSAVVSF
jgi:hypothetical protein